MENWLIDLLQLPEACQVEEVLPPYFLSKNFTLTPGEKNLEKFSIDAMAIVAAIGPDYGDVPASEEMKSVAMLVIETKGGKLLKEAGKIAEMLHHYVPQHLLIGLTDGETAFLSIAKKNEAMQVEETFITKPLIPEAMVALSAKFDFEKMDKTNLNSLWSGYCELIKT